MSLVLIGARGSGKSAVGVELAQRLDYEFVDLDRAVEAAAGKSVAEIFASTSEAEFRRLETIALAGLSDRQETVVATGGGAVIAAQNRKILRELGKVFWLKVSPEVAVARTAGSNSRPALTELEPLEEAREVARSRRACYEEVADEMIDTDSLALLEVCDELEQLWRAAARDDVR
ncbi:MAG: shikimate kinase [Deltaproteobacteria bacterium]|nr:shikimate kinase [Deltaproteobacteria bacterium]